MELLDSLLRPTASRACFSASATLQGMLDFEAALAEAQADSGVIPIEAVDPIRQACRAERFDPSQIAAEAARAGNLAIPLIKHLTAAVKSQNPDAARFVHWGATSQDVIDTGLVLQLKGALRLIEADLDRLIAALASQAASHRDTVMIGRTWLQHALPLTFGLKLAGSLDAVLRQRAQLQALKPEMLSLQFGGAAGTLASLRDKGPQVACRLAANLGLAEPDLPWHSQRDRIAGAAAFFGTLTGTLGKLARDISLMAQTEVAELAEAADEGRGGSSTMPHKRNPVACAAILCAAQRTPQLVATIMAAMIQEHERGLGGWHAEWEALPELVLLCGGALATSAGLIEGLEVFPDRMRGNLELTHGLVMAEAVTMALGETLGRLEAHKLVEKKCREAVATGADLQQILAGDERIAAILSPEALARLMAPENYTGAAAIFVDRVLERVRRLV
ncbi:3-carboxy-cis,cis-muconate cycloisomerase [Paralcaligenes sp. KSB-10]|uniref:3-carboxy-cis,cis-muconate cycloisomerase n=1 Tax=Paralcaligenes sp. KSB-10 TaxID=2901142 RepID=UPI001E2AA09C|nr:3-carboxy-cis,cis-muconate cycloisomerase [Paralcaligenes sp. KSB-10]UHL66023.1 3-carboxy-cis,cis-muconate cycloisomerase [Paralcaligenes sp. KSB-10]